MRLTTPATAQYHGNTIKLLKPFCSSWAMHANHTQYHPNTTKLCRLSVHQGQCMPTTHNVIFLFIKDSVCQQHTMSSFCSPRTVYANHTIPGAILSRCAGLGPKEFTSELGSALILTGEPHEACTGQHLLTFRSLSLALKRRQCQPDAVCGEARCSVSTHQIGEARCSVSD